MQGLKTKFIFGCFVIVAATMTWKLYSLQIKQGENYQAWASGLRVSSERVLEKRGEIFLKNGQDANINFQAEGERSLPLARVKKKVLMYIFPNEIPLNELKSQSEFLANIFGEEPEKFIEEITKGEVLKREPAEENMQKIKAENFAGVYFDVVPGRFYPYKNLASHIIGFVNDGGEGQYGIEGFYNEVLRGKENEESLQKGGDLWLTLDYNIQYFAEDLLKEAKAEWDIDAGQIIVSEPTSGKIIALATLPSFDPGQYGGEKNLELFLNPTTQKLFEPGSVFKPITMAAALEEGLLTPETEYEDKGFVDVGGPPIYNFKKRVWGKQTMTDVLEESINTGAIFVQQKLGNKKFLNYLEKFGFFEKTEIDLQGEVFSSNEGLKNGYPRDFATASFGQGIEITPIQLVRAFGALANGGKLKKPHLVEKIVKSDNEEIVTQPRTQREVISETTAAKLTSMLVSVIEHGSGRKAKIEGYFIAGKTGTAQVPSREGGYSEEKTIQSFLGYFPALSPKFLIFVKLDNPKGVTTAEYSAAPIFGKLAKHIIDLRQIPPDYE